MKSEDWNHKRILIIKLRYIGDTLTLFPVVSSIKRKYPGAFVSVLVNQGTEGLIRCHPDIDEILALERRTKEDDSFLKRLGRQGHFLVKLRKSGFDAVIDYSHGDRSALLSWVSGAGLRIGYDYGNKWFSRLFNHLLSLQARNYHIVDYQLEALRSLGIGDFDRLPVLPVPPEKERLVNGLLGAKNNGILQIVIHPGARTRFRRWAPERFAAVARRIKKEYASSEIILVGAEEDRRALDEIEAEMGFRPRLRTTALDLMGLAALLKRGDLFLGNDSAPGHIAAAVGCPVVSIFGPTFPRMWHPLALKGEVVFKNTPCCGCRQEICREDMKCMRSITTEEVWEAVTRVLGRAQE